MWKLCPGIPKQDHRYFNDNYYNCLAFAELQKKSLFLSLLNAVGRIFLSTLGCDSRSVDLEAPFICAGDLWLAQPPSSSSLSIAFGLAKSKENQLGNQRGSYSQKTEERGFRCGLCCHWTNGGKRQQEGAIADLAVSDRKLQRRRQVSAVPQPTEAHHGECVNWTLPNTAFHMCEIMSPFCKA